MSVEEKIIVQYTYSIKFFLRDIRPVAGSDGSEGVLDFLRTLNVLGFFADHESHVFL